MMWSLLGLAAIGCSYVQYRQYKFLQGAYSDVVKQECCLTVKEASEKKS
jgi:hypothetical protein